MNFNAKEFDILKEIGNIGAGNAVTALAKLLQKKVDMQVPVINLVEFKDIASFLGGPEQIVVGILVQISGDIEGMMMFLVQEDSADVLIRALMNGLSAEKRESGFTEIELSALQEIGNILTSSYLGSLAGLIQKKIVPSIPFLSIDMANAILSVPAIEFGKVADKALFIESVFEADGVSVSGYFLLIPDISSLRVILTSLGVE
ncbi:MAG: chemotaxis protein CheC [Clostridiales bacterium]|jgi:chemotaxis protein CheC|nr:chemotaxis protein CheC [Clostridiales bacterium]